MPGADNALFRWTSVPNAETYTLHVYGNSANTEEIVYITFDRDGCVTGLHFASHTQARKHEADSPYTDQLFFYTLQGLQANTDYWYAISCEDTHNQTRQLIDGTFHTTEAKTPTSVDCIKENRETLNVQKILHNRQVYLMYEGQIYDVQGRKIENL